jgi:hypothetical protein
MVNHFRFIISYKEVGKPKKGQTKKAKYQVTDFEVELKSLQAKPSNSWSSLKSNDSSSHKLTYGCNYGDDVFSYPVKTFQLEESLGSQGIFFTYDVIWKESNKKYGTNWDDSETFKLEELVDEFAVFLIFCIALTLALRYGINSYVKRKVTLSNVTKSSYSDPLARRRDTLLDWKLSELISRRFNSYYREIEMEVLVRRRIPCSESATIAMHNRRNWFTAMLDGSHRMPSCHSVFF